jgi:TonB family protein
MNRDLIFSIGAHAVIVLGTLFLSPLEHRKPIPMGEVIRVSAVAMSDITPREEPIAPPPEAPAPMVKAEPEVSIPEPETKPEVEIEQPVEEPVVDEPAPDPEPDPEPEEKPEPPDNDKPAIRDPNAGEGDRNQTGVEGGSTEVETPSGSAITGASIDNASFNYPYWFNLAWAKISQNFRVPVVIDGQVYCDVYFQVIKSGKVIESRIVNPSGIDQFDQACLAAIDRSSPFPPLPREFLDEIIGITITFTN